MNIRINFDYYDQILSVYGRIISKKQTSNVYKAFNSRKSLNGCLNTYVSKSITTLKKVIQLALSSDNENLAYAALEVFNYLTLPNTINSDNNRSYQSYFNDAWLIYNFAKYCVDKGYFPASAFEDILAENVKIDAYMSKDISKTISLELNKTLNKITKEFQL